MGNNNLCHFDQIEYCFFETLKSTHRFALDQCWNGRLNKRNMVVVFAAQQTEGMGSHNRSWRTSGNDFHINFVFLWDKVLPFSQIAAFTACQFLNRLTENHYHFQLKWPNDIYVQGCKVGGCLSYVRSENDHIWATVGVGINFNLSKEIAKSIEQPATSLKILLNNTEDYPTSELFKYIQNFSELFVQNLHWYHTSGITQFFHDASPLWLYHRDKIRIYDEDKKQWLCGIFETIDPNGGLVIKTEQDTSVIVLNGTHLRCEKDPN
jgi:BirA family transcriptional regulator, biotin operon repressor / biotin---[acetyl-CoA-carboxylase] ligase